MFIVQGITPATSTTSAMPEIVTTFERANDANRFIQLFNPLTQDKKDKLKGKSLTISDVLEKEELVEKEIKIKNKYTVMFVESV